MPKTKKFPHRGKCPPNEGIEYYLFAPSNFKTKIILNTQYENHQENDLL